MKIGEMHIQTLMAVVQRISTVASKAQYGPPMAESSQEVAVYKELVDPKLRCPWHIIFQDYCMLSCETYSTVVNR